jgi:serine/threonine protein phosphatase PrpC
MQESSGAAAVAGVICGQELIVAHVGDCRAVLASKVSSIKAL